MAFQPPGAEFLKRRLARATAVPPAERSANVAAFVESMQLMLDNPELLPLNSEGTAALPDTPDRRSKVGWPAGCLYRLHVPPAAGCRPGVSSWPTKTAAICPTLSGAVGDAHGRTRRLLLPKCGAHQTSVFPPLPSILL